MNSKTTKNQINCIYAGGTMFSAKVEAFLKSSKKHIRAVDITKTMPSDTIWHDIAKRLGISLKALIDPGGVEGFDQTATYAEESLVKILAQNPRALKGAIVMEDDHIAHITTYTHLLKFYNVDSAGLEKTFHTENPVIKSQTEDESYI